MKVIRSLSEIKRYPRAVVCLGVFDGVHLAHRRILRDAVRKARAIKGRSVAVTFWPHPQKEEALYSLNHRIRLIGQLGIDTCVVIRFNKAFARLSAERFISLLVKKLGAEYIYVGENFRFGRRAEGDTRLLGRLSRRYNFTLCLYDVMKIRGRPISSTYIRRLITCGDLKNAELLLGTPVSVLGTVKKGDSLARAWGMPTANIDPHHEIIPPSGVYASRVRLNNRTFPAVCYVGIRPTIVKQKTKSKPKNIEVHLFGLRRDIYGQELQVQFIKKIRAERRFVSIEALVRQIKKDTFSARKIISLH
jgi:riboflavin kinase/FMN adenylyltransferase